VSLSIKAQVSQLEKKTNPGEDFHGV